MSSRPFSLVVAACGVVGVAAWTAPSSTVSPAGTAWDLHVELTPAVTPAQSEALRSALQTLASGAVPDTALDELAAGRFWHAARLLRAAGAATAAPRDVLTLARAEAGWENWPAVATLLEHQSWLRDEDGGWGLYLLGRSQEEAERWGEAAAAYRAYNDVVGLGIPSSLAAVARRARTSWRAGDGAQADRALATLTSTPGLRSWLAVELAQRAAEHGDVEGLDLLLTHVVEPRARDVLWRARADALLERGDSSAATVELERLVSSSTQERGAIALVELGRLRIAAGDSTVGRTDLLEAYPASSGRARIRAAEALHDLGGHDADLTLELARILDRAGDGARALSGYDRAVRLSEEGLPQGSRLERARLLSTVQSRQEEALEEFRAIRETPETDRIGSRNLELWAQMRRRQGMSAQVSTLRRWLLEEYPGSSEAAEVAWSRGSNAEAAGRLDEALGHYRALAGNARTHARAGQARMRTGQIHLRGGDLGAAAAVFESYLNDFPNGRRWQEAAYWAGRTRLQLGDSTAARGHLRHTLSQPIEYYAVMAADLLDTEFRVDLPPGEAPSEPGWLTEGLARLDLLTDAGVEVGAEAEIRRLRERAADERAVRLRLAEALIERGRTIDGINLGWSILADGNGWDQSVLGVTYPFPYETLVRREAAEWGIDVFMMAAIIRQESAFKADIVSSAGAIGLMQVMPPTGAQLARAHGPSGFTEESLTRPEVNLHLGAAFFVDMSRRYDDELPLVLSAYNAGPTRATRWRRYPEAADPLRFTERIPFVETRGYVKSVRRNLGLYRAIYGQD